MAFDMFTSRTSHIKMEGEQDLAALALALFPYLGPAEGSLLTHIWWLGMW